VERLCEASSSPEMDRTQGLFVFGNKKANRMGWLLCKTNLGGLGRSRTTDTRIFNLHVGVKSSPVLALIVYSAALLDACASGRTKKSSRVLPSTSKALSHLGAGPRPLHSWPSGPRYFAAKAAAGFLPLDGLGAGALGERALGAGRLSSSAVMP